MTLQLAAVLAAGVYFIFKKQPSEADENTMGNTPTRFALDAQTTHFALAEFNSKDGKEVPLNYRGNIQLLMNQLEVLRAAIGGTPIRINSGYRSPAHNKKVGGASNSRHLYGMAADIRAASGYSPKQLHAVIMQLIASGKMRDGGLKCYPTFVHYDISTPRRW